MSVVFYPIFMHNLVRPSPFALSNIYNTRCFLIRNRYPKSRSSPKNGLKAIRTRLFFNFWQIFAKVPQFHRPYFEKSSKTAKIWQRNEEKPCSTSTKVLESKNIDLTHFSTVKYQAKASGTHSATSVCVVNIIFSINYI